MKKKQKKTIRRKQSGTRKIVDKVIQMPLPSPVSNEGCCVVEADPLSALRASGLVSEEETPRLTTTVDCLIFSRTDSTRGFRIPGTEGYAVVPALRKGQILTSVIFKFTNF